MSSSDAPPEGLDPDVLKRLVTIEVRAENVEKMRHVARVGKFEFSSDEPERMGGDDEYPYPLHYLAAGIGF